VTAWLLGYKCTRSTYDICRPRTSRCTATRPLRHNYWLHSVRNTKHFRWWNAFHNMFRLDRWSFILVFVWDKSVHVWRGYARKTIFTFSFPVAFSDLLDLNFAPVVLVQVMSPLNFKFLWLNCFKTAGGTGRMDGRTDERVQHLMRRPREDRIEWTKGMWGMWQADRQISQNNAFSPVKCTRRMIRVECGKCLTHSVDVVTKKVNWRNVDE